jgi:hypothetical protein
MNYPQYIAYCKRTDHGHKCGVILPSRGYTVWTLVCDTVGLLVAIVALVAFVVCLV